MKTTPEQRAALRRAYVVAGNAGAREVAVLDDLDTLERLVSTLTTDLDEVLAERADRLAEVTALRAVAEAARARCRDAVPEWAPELRAALRAWEERER